MDESNLTTRPRKRGSIPARAGEPTERQSQHLPWRVYPRACGGTRRLLATCEDYGGLSPRVRGNPVCQGTGASGQLSIPARAGEPNSRRYPTKYSGVYPRACGGTTDADTPTQWLAGLSPRVRGNPERMAHYTEAERSIPARAGEPAVHRISSGVTGVYPRACGGTPLAGAVMVAPPGLSPRVRGNLWLADRERTTPGSIPARAGEPGRRVCGGWMIRVYPRACGGTVHAGGPPDVRRGLSPRVRGNHDL